MCDVNASHAIFINFYVLIYKKNFEYELGFSSVCRILIDAATGLAYLHSNEGSSKPVIHLDVKRYYIQTLPYIIIII